MDLSSAENADERLADGNTKRDDGSYTPYCLEKVACRPVAVAVEGVIWFLDGEKREEYGVANT